MTARSTLVIAALLGTLAVALGAFAAHGLQTLLNERLLQVFQIGVQYQFYHVFALLLTGLLQQRRDSRGLRLAAILFLLGDRKSTRLNSSHVRISYAVFCLKKKNRQNRRCTDI